MQLIRNLDELPEHLCRGAVSIGNFDGVHRGHARLVGRLVELARRMQAPAVVFTFDPHPVQILHPEKAPSPLGWTELNAELLDALNVDALIAYPTDRAFLQLDARPFFDEIVCGRLKARAMVEGPNFFFGRNRAGTVDLLRQFCTDAGLQFEVIGPVEIGGDVVSSSRIRSLVASGRVAEARSLLGRPYRIRGVVARGAGRGARLGYPTANLNPHHEVFPPGGVYASEALVDGLWLPALTSIGRRLTFHRSNSRVVIEVYILDFKGDLYGRELEVRIIDRLRDQWRFDSSEDLCRQLETDEAQLRERIARR